MKDSDTNILDIACKEIFSVSSAFGNNVQDNSGIEILEVIYYKPYLGTPKCVTGLTMSNYDINSLGQAQTEICDASPMLLENEHQVIIGSLDHILTRSEFDYPRKLAMLENKLTEAVNKILWMESLIIKLHNR